MPLAFCQHCSASCSALRRDSRWNLASNNQLQPATQNSQQWA
jgi:hypothetical protein